jgi:G:T-mismatch repair DNA endonuclease (very short patch repair protein)
MPNTYVRRPEDRKPKDGAHTQRVFVPKWIDPFPWIQGSSIEKMVMAELVRRGIYFEHTPQRNSLGGFVDPTWEPDFLLPQYHIWIEIQGAYFHTLPGAVEKDALRFAMIEAAGWKPIFWWEDDIRTRLIEIMDQVPELYRVNRKLNDRKSFRRTKGLPFFEGGDGVDHLKGLRAALSGRARPPQKLKVKRRRKRRPK